MKKLLVLAAGILQVPVIKKAREMGYFVIAADGNPNACGLQYADKSVCANIIDEEVMLNIAREEQIDGVIHPCSEVSMHVMGRINDELGLSGISRDQAIRATNKHLMRKAFGEYGAPSPKSYCFEDSEEAWNCFMQFDTDGILKPSRNSGSRGISKISRLSSDEHCSENKFKELFDISKSESRDSSVMLEQFIDGPEFSVEIIVWDNKVNVLTVTDKKTTGSPHFVELGHNQPSVFPDDVVVKIKEAAVSGVKALDVNNCACHAEVKVQDGKAYLMEVGARLGGDFISTVLTPLSTGVDMVAAAIDCSLGVVPDLAPKSVPKAVCIRYFCPKPGRLNAITGLEVLNDSRVFEWEMYHGIGDDIPDATSSLSRSGHVIVTEESPEKAVVLADQLLEKVELRTINI